MAINLYKFIGKFNEEYNFIYKAQKEGSYVVGYDEAVNAFDEFLKTHRSFVSQFCTFRGDFISSDREAAAFMFALESMGLL